MMIIVKQSLRGPRWFIKPCFIIKFNIERFSQRIDNGGMRMIQISNIGTINRFPWFQRRKKRIEICRHELEFPTVRFIYISNQIAIVTSTLCNTK